jgi:SAM-dependent methyltransferase
MTRRLTLPDSGAPEGADARRHAPSAERNKDAIVAALAGILPEKGRALEIASGTGQHIARLAALHPGVRWQPSDANPDNLGSIAAWAAAAGCDNLCAPIVLNAAVAGWAAGLAGQDLILVVNLLHLVSGAEADCVLAEAAAALAPGGRLAVYGPFMRDGMTTSAGDAAFHDSLRQQDPAIGYKDQAWVQGRMAAAGLIPEPPVAMPANNLFLIARRAV